MSRLALGVMVLVVASLWSPGTMANDASGAAAPTSMPAGRSTARPQVEQNPPPEGDAWLERPGNAQRLFGWIAVGIGSAAVVTGVVLAGVAADRYADLDCPEDRCPTELHDDATAYNDLRLPSGLTILGGALLVGIGLPFLLVGEAESEEASVSPMLGPGYAGLRGRF